jgi:hypothetical protein
MFAAASSGDKLQPAPSRPSCTTSDERAVAGSSGGGGTRRSAVSAGRPGGGTAARSAVECMWVWWELWWVWGEHGGGQHGGECRGAAERRGAAWGTTWGRAGMLGLGPGWCCAGAQGGRRRRATARAATAVCRGDSDDRCSMMVCGVAWAAGMMPLLLSSSIGRQLGAVRDQGGARASKAGSAVGVVLNGATGDA